MSSYAQYTDTVIKNNTIEITQSYQPEIKQNPKPALHAILPPVDTTHPIFNYDVPQQTLYYTYSSTPIRPLALGKDTSYNTYPNYVKLGYGNLSTIFLEYGEEGKGPDLFHVPSEHSIYIHSIYQKGSIKNQQSWLTDMREAGSIYGKKLVWNNSLDILNNQYYCYGYDHNLYQYDAGKVKQNYTGVHVGLNAMNEGLSNINYNPGISFNAYTGTILDSSSNKAKEYSCIITVPISYNIDTSLQLKASINAAITQYSVSQISISNNIFQFVPGIEYHGGLMSGHAYLNPTVGKDATYFLPDIFAAYRLTENHIVLSAGLRGSLVQNTYEQLSTDNPYMNTLTGIKQTHSTEVFGNIDVSIGHHISITGRLSWWQYENMPVFVNSIGDMKQFDILYESQLNAISLFAALKYQISNNLSVRISTTSYNFSNGSLVKPWHVPTSRIKGDILFQPNKKLYVTGYLNILGGITAIDNNNNPITLDGIADLGGSIEYEIVSRLSLFGQACNLLNNKNERWLGYQGYGFNVFGGIRLKF